MDTQSAPNRSPSSDTNQHDKSQHVYGILGWMIYTWYIPDIYLIYTWYIPDIPSGKLTWLWKITIFYGKSHYKWQFSIAMLVYQRVYYFWYIPDIFLIDTWYISDIYLIYTWYIPDIYLIYIPDIYLIYIPDIYLIDTWYISDRYLIYFW